MPGESVRLLKTGANLVGWANPLVDLNKYFKNAFFEVN
jgi:hypothetical protein